MRLEDLKQSYSEKYFTEINNLLIDSQFSPSNLSVEPETAKFVKSVKYLGQYPELGLHVLVVHHSSNNDARIGVGTDIFRIMKKYSFPNAIIAAFSKESSAWRYSLVTSNLEIDNKGKITRDFSSPRRYSFMLGPEQKVVTPYRQLIDLGPITTIKDLTKRFSLEVVNYEFYKSISGLFEALVGSSDAVLNKELTEIISNLTEIEKLKTDKQGTHYRIEPLIEYPGTEEEKQEFAVRLIGRVIFCWFLREKKSEKGLSLISKGILSKDASMQDNYYSNTLEPLFFELLNRPVELRKEKFKTTSYSQIPYLNGGLFSPDKVDRYAFKRKSSTNTPSDLTVPDTWVRSFFDLLETYNFTVDENTSFDIDLSIDPEMLGRIFENLLARLNPETGNTVRRGTGSYYTPRNIVDHMVDESIVNYLHSSLKISLPKIKALVSYDLEDDLQYPITKEDGQKVIDALGKIRILDPACGSGAYPIGILQKIVYIFEKIDPNGKMWLDSQLRGSDPEIRSVLKREFSVKNINYLRKLGVIRKSIYGVDIQPIATEIARLRCFLTLIVDQNIEDNTKNRGIEPLPNLDFKFVSANTLLAMPDKQTHDKVIQPDLFDTTQKDKIDQLRLLREEYFVAHHTEKSEIRAEFGEVQNELWASMHESSAYGLQSLVLSKWNPFSYEATDWFDPEWMFGITGGFDIVIANPPYGLLNKRQNQKIGHDVTKEHISYFKDSDLYEPARGGMINVYRLFIIKSIDLLKSGGTFVEIFPLAFAGDLSASNLRKHLASQHNIIGIDAFPERDDQSKRVFEAAKMSVCILYLNKTTRPHDDFFVRINTDRFVDLNSKPTHLNSTILNTIDPADLTIPLLSPDELAIIEKVYSKSKRIADIGHCYTGEVDLTLDKKFITSDNKDSILLKGAIIGKYLIRDKMSQGEIEFLNKSDYLRNKNNTRSKHFNNQRIVMQAITGVNEKTRIKAAIAEPGMYCANSVNYIAIDSTSYSINFVLGLINSKLINFVFKKFSTNSNVNGYEVDKLPIPSLDDNESKKFAADIDMKVSKILKVKSENSLADTFSLENAIDTLVLKLFRITKEEKGVINNE